MLKTFTLISREEKKIKANHGTINFTIVDENNHTRTVSGTTFLDENDIAQGVSTEHKRELPLIEGLFRLELNESIEIEFQYFNEVFDRETNKTANQLAYEAVKEMEKEQSLLYRITKFFKGSSEKQLSSEA